MDELTRAALYLALLAQPRVGLVSAHQLVWMAGGLEQLVSTDWSARSSVRLDKNDSWGPPSADALKLLRGLRSRIAASLPEAKRAVSEATRAGLEVITVDGQGYPPALRDEAVIPPPVLFVEGRLPAALSAAYEDLRACAVVGTRRASRFSTTFAKDVASGLVELGVVVVSGLALGIDAAAHAGALEALQRAPESGGGTVGVLGGGHHRFHPAANRSLARAIVAAGGAVVSEWPPDVDPAPYQFLQRNRVISGLSRGVLIVEAGARSGAVNTASHALTQGRDVLAVPGRPGPQMAGNLALIVDGAKLFITLGDLEATFADVPGAAAAFRALSSAGRPSGSQQEDRSATGGSADTLTGRVHSVLERLGEVSIDQLIDTLPSSPERSSRRQDEAVSGPRAQTTPTAPTVSQLTAALLELELAGLVEAGHDGRYHLRVSTAAERRPRRGGA